MKDLEGRIRDMLAQRVNEVYDLTVDNSGNVYVTGAVKNQNTGYDIATYKLDNQLNLIWERHFDGYNSEDKGQGIKVDNQGNVYIAGYVSNPNGGDNYALIKYNSSGVLQWSREYNGIANGDDKAVQLVIDDNQNIYVTGAAVNHNDKDFETVIYNSQGNIITQATYEGYTGNNDVPTGIAIDLNGDIIVVGQTKYPNGNYKTQTVKYRLYKKPIQPVYDNNGDPKYNSNEVLVRFNSDLVTHSAIDRKGFLAGQLSDFVNPAVISKMSTKLGMDVSRLTTFKIFKRMTTADSLSITRLGDTIKVSDFWATLSIFFPKSFTVEQVVDSLSELKEIIYFAQPNHIGHLLNAPNDPMYDAPFPYGQQGLYDSIYGINVDGAWKKQVGQDYVKVGVYGTGVNWRHEDFGDGTWNGSKIAGGWDYVYNVSPKNQTNPDVSWGHGTAVAGIIGALRNNGKGVAGIAGGDVDSLNNTGVELYSFGISLFDDASIAEAIREGCGKSLSFPNINYNIDVQNFSWKTHKSPVLRNAILASYRNGVTTVVASGEVDSIPFYNYPIYPASYNDNWILKVGGNDTTGSRWQRSFYDYNMDLIAPSVTGTWQSTALGNSSYGTGNGNSYAAPQVTGVAALMLSEHNPLNNPLYPNVLSPEDVEYILQKTATPVTKDAIGGNNLPVPNKYAGYGRINAGKAINKVGLPYRIFHQYFMGNTSNATLYASNQNIAFPEGISGLPVGGYHVGTTDIYKLTITVPFPIYTNVTYLDFWVRNSSSDLYGLTDTIYNSQWSGIVLDTVTQNTITMTGYIYKTKIIDNNNNLVQYKWFPTDLLSSVKFAYSIYTIDDNPNLGIVKETKADSIYLYPNPATNQLNFSIPTLSNSLKVTICDISGRTIKNIGYKASNNGVYNQTIDISNLSRGLYLCKFNYGGKQVTRKFIKH